MLCAVNDAVVNGLISGGLGLMGVIFGWLLSRCQQQAADRRLERERLLTQMQQLVVAVSELTAARKTHQEMWFGRRARVRMWAVTAVESWSAWHRAGGGVKGAAHILAPYTRTLNEWAQRSVDGAAALAPYLARVAAAGLPLGMADDPAIASAAQRLTDAALQDGGDDAVHAAVVALRAALYPEETERP
jgi:hypothetical protein